MFMIGGIMDFARNLLTAMREVLDPLIGHNFIERCSLPGVDLQHETDDISALSW